MAIFPAAEGKFDCGFKGVCFIPRFVGVLVRVPMGPFGNWTMLCVKHGLIFGCL